MPRKKATVSPSTPSAETPSLDNLAPVDHKAVVSELASALTAAIETARPTKKNIFQRTGKSPWEPKDGSPKLKLRKPFHQHGILVDSAFLDNEEIALINKLKPGSFCGGLIRVTRRRDKGIDIDWPVRDGAQRLKLISQYGLRDLKEIIVHCIEEAAKPKPVGEEYDDLD